MLNDLPIHPISYKILLAEYKNVNDAPSGKYPNAIIRISSRDLLNDLLRFRYTSKRAKLRRISEKLTTVITIDCKAKIRNVHQVGYYLYKIHKNQIFRFIHASVLAGRPATEALRTFCSIYNINDDDINIETLERQWRAYKKENIKLFAADPAKNETLKRRNAFAHSPALIPLSKNEIQALVSNCVKQNLDSFFTARDTFNKSRLDQALCFAYYDLGQFVQIEIAAMQKVNVSTVCRRISNFRKFLAKAPAVANSYDLASKATL